MADDRNYYKSFNVCIVCVCVLCIAMCCPYSCSPGFCFVPEPSVFVYATFAVGRIPSESRRDFFMRTRKRAGLRSRFYAARSTRWPKHKRIIGNRIWWVQRLYMLMVCICVGMRRYSRNVCARIDWYIQQQKHTYELLPPFVEQWTTWTHSRCVCSLHTYDSIRSTESVFLLLL